MKKLEVNEIKEQYRDLIEFSYSGDDFKRTSTVRDYLNKVFCSKIKAVFISQPERTDDKDSMNKFGLSWDCQSIILVNEKEQVVFLTNSEWATISFLKG